MGLPGQGRTCGSWRQPAPRIADGIPAAWWWSWMIDALALVVQLLLALALAPFALALLVIGLLVIATLTWPADDDDGGRK